MKWALCASAVVVCFGCSSSSTGAGDAGAPADAGVPADSGASADATSAGDTWDSWAKGFFASYCVECHSASDTTGRDYTSKANVVRDQAEIRCGVASVQDPSWGCKSFPPPKQFPISNAAGTNPKPTDAERARAVAWITAGSP